MNGIRLDKAANNSGVIYRLSLVPNSAPAELETVPVYPPIVTPGGPAPIAPDGIAFGKSGDLYVALAGSSQISILAPNGVEKNRLNRPAKVPNSAGIVAWANPANIAFTHQDGTILVTNHASLIPYDPGLFNAFDVFVGDKGQPLP